MELFHSNMLEYLATGFLDETIVVLGLHPGPSKETLSRTVSGGMRNP